MTQVVHLELKISPHILKKFESALLGYSEAWGKLIHQKKLRQKSRGTVPLTLHSVYYFSGTDDPLVRETLLHRELCIQGKCVLWPTSRF
jgi:hypothetical protein